MEVKLGEQSSFKKRPTFQKEINNKCDLKTNDNKTNYRKKKKAKLEDTNCIHRLYEGLRQSLSKL